MLDTTEFDEGMEFLRAFYAYQGNDIEIPETTMSLWQRFLQWWFS
jgi:hypothetical protein